MKCTDQISTVGHATISKQIAVDPIQNPRHTLSTFSVKYRIFVFIECNIRFVLNCIKYRLALDCIRMRLSTLKIKCNVE